MTRRPVRLCILLIAIVVSGAAAWRATTNEQMRGAARTAAQATDRAAADALAGLADLRATLYAYVAPGQNVRFWAARSSTILDSVKTHLRQVDEAAAASGVPLTHAPDELDRLASSEVRIRQHVEAGQPRLAGDVIFSDARVLLDAIGTEIAEARHTVARTASSRDVGISNEQALLAGAVLGTWFLMAMLLVPIPRERPGRVAAPATSRSVEPDLSLHANAPPARPSSVGGPAPTPPRPAPPPPVAVPAPPIAPALSPAVIAALGALCSDVSRVTDVTAIDPLLGRAANLLGATGLVLWMATPESDSLVPAASHGYDARTLAHIGTIPLTADNLTVQAFTSRVTITRAAAGSTPAGVAVPLLSAVGSTGVLSAEVPGDRDVDAVAAMASVLAAQLGSLLSASPAVGDEPQEHAQA